MNAFTNQVKTNIIRIIVRNPRFMAFDIGVPALFYILFTKVMNQGLPASFEKTYLVSMAIYATLLSSIITVANTVLSDKEQAYIRFIDVSPVSRNTYYASMGIVLFILTMVEIAVIELIAKLYIGVSMSVINWLVILTVVTIASIPLMIFGVSLSFVGSNTVVNLMVNLIVFPAAILSGLWWPLSMMPTWSQTIGKLLPTYQTSVIVNDVMKQTAVPLKMIGGELVWLVLAIGLLVVVQKIQRTKRAQ